MGRFNDRLRTFMQGRYGNDQLNRFMSFLALILIVVDLFVKSRFLYIIALVLMILMYVRMLSKNVSARYAENQKYLNLRYKLICKINIRELKMRHENRKIYKFYKCPTCSQKIRVPKGKGRICITCPKCKGEFVKRT